MANSLVAAWFILPLGDALLLDLTTLPSLALLVCALAVIIRICTGTAGLAWAPWLTLLLLSAPLVRGSLLVSADLFYAAGLLAVFAAMLQIVTAGDAVLADWLALAAAIGLLLGSKATGVFSAAVLGLTFLAIVAILPGRDRRLASLRPLASRIPILVATIVAAGGMWTFRNWIAYGSPMAPSGLTVFEVSIFEGQSYQASKHYLSVLGDMNANPGYRPLDRALYHAARMIGPWFSPLLLVLLLAPVAGIGQMAQRQPLDRWIRASVWTLIWGALLAAVHAAVLAGAPWTSLEWTRGLGLRYVLPFLILVPALAVAGTIAVIRAVSSSRLITRLTMAGVAAASVAAFLRYGSTPGLPREEWLPILTIPHSIAAVVIAASIAASARAGRTAASISLSMAGVLAVAAFSIAAVDRHDRLASEATSVFARERACAEVGGAELADSRGIYYAVEHTERRSGRACDARRFFVLTRFDAPLDLQGPEYRNLVYDLTGRNMRPRALAAAAPGRACDYAIASAEDPEASDAGRALGVDRPALEVGVAGRFRAFALGPAR
jgi:hypothetical protein